VVSGGAEDGTRATVDGVLTAVAAQAEAAWPVVKFGSDALTLDEAGAAVETVIDVLESAWQMLGPLVERVAQIHEREMTDEREGAARAATEHAWVHLNYGKKGLMVAYHLLSTGRGELLDVERGKV
jgi:hypothetical protein